jgi:hypothetical protein
MPGKHAVPIVFLGEGICAKSLRRAVNLNLFSTFGKDRIDPLWR